MDDRARLLMAGVPKTAKVIEIGPSLNPLAPKREGWNVTVVDHETREGLIHKYRHDATVDPAVIEEVDLVWHGGSLEDLVGRASWGTYDAFIASHVIEHTTDVVSFLRSARVLLKDEGVVILAVPDKRKCFDFFRPISTTGDAVVAFKEKRSRHTAKTHFDYLMHHGHRGGSPGWSIETQTPFVLAAGIESGMDALALSERPEYVDAHAWMFTPSSFELMVLELRALGLLTLAVEQVQVRPDTEFLARLRPCEEIEDMPTINRYRHGLMERIVVEQAEASRQVVGAALGNLEGLRTGFRSLLADYT